MSYEKINNFPIKRNIRKIKIVCWKIYRNRVMSKNRRTKLLQILEFVEKKKYCILHHRL